MRTLCNNFVNKYCNKEITGDKTISWMLHLVSVSRSLGLPSPLRRSLSSWLRRLQQCNMTSVNQHHRHAHKNGRRGRGRPQWEGVGRRSRALQWTRPPALIGNPVLAYGQCYSLVHATIEQQKQHHCTTNSKFCSASSDHSTMWDDDVMLPIRNAKRDIT